jgi:hypothetical protein
MSSTNNHIINNNNITNQHYLSIENQSLERNNQWYREYNESLTNQCENARYINDIAKTMLALALTTTPLPTLKYALKFTWFFIAAHMLYTRNQVIRIGTSTTRTEIRNEIREANQRISRLGDLSNFCSLVTLTAAIFSSIFQKQDNIPILVTAYTFFFICTTALNLTRPGAYFGLSQFRNN